MKACFFSSSTVLAQEAESAGQPFPWHSLQVLRTSSICLHRVPRQVRNTLIQARQTGPNCAVAYRLNQEQVLCEVGQLILFPLLTYQSDIPPSILI